MPKPRELPRDTLAHHGFEPHFQGFCEVDNMSCFGCDTIIPRSPGRTRSNGACQRRGERLWACDWFRNPSTKSSGGTDWPARSGCRGSRHQLRRSPPLLNTSACLISTSPTRLCKALIPPVSPPGFPGCTVPWRRARPVHAGATELIAGASYPPEYGGRNLHRFSLR